MFRRQRSPLIPLGVAMFVLAVVTSGIGMIPLMSSAFEEPQAYGTSEPRVLPTTPGERYMVWVRKSAPESPACTASDATSGQALAVDQVSRYQHEGLRSITRFEAGSAQTELSCSGGRRQTVYVTTAYDERWLVARLTPVFAPFVGFGAAGAVCLWLGLRRAHRGRG